MLTVMIPTRTYWARYLFGDRRGKLSPAGLALAREEYLAAVEHDLAAALSAVPAVIRSTDAARTRKEKPSAASKGSVREEKFEPSAISRKFVQALEHSGVSKTLVEAVRKKQRTPSPT